MNVVVGASGTGIGVPVGAEGNDVLVVGHPRKEDVHRFALTDLRGGAVQVELGLVRSHRCRIVQAGESDHRNQRGQRQHPEGEHRSPEQHHFCRFHFCPCQYG